MTLVYQFIQPSIHLFIYSSNHPHIHSSNYRANHSCISKLFIQPSIHLLLIQPSIHSFSYPFIYYINVFIIYTKPHNTQLHKPSIYPSNKPIYVLFHPFNHSPNQPFIHLFIRPSIQLPFYLLMFKPSIHLLHQCPPALGPWGSGVLLEPGHHMWTGCSSGTGSTLVPTIGTKPSVCHCDRQTSFGPGLCLACELMTMLWYCGERSLT